MNDTTVTLVGNVATGVEYRDTATGGVARFRFAVTARRWDRERGAWADGHTSFYTVFAWRALGVNLAASVSVGEPLVVHGRLKVREEERDGQRKTFVDIDAVAVGHDLSRGTAAFRRVVKGEPRLTERQENGVAGDSRDPWDARPTPPTEGPAPSPVAPAVAAKAAPLVTHVLEPVP
ncbi:single-stranded DNA-binding protein [Streptomyces sp. NPDC054861]